jgi:hypothetical protein
MYRVPLLALCLSLLLSAALAAQQPSHPVRSGDQVRIRSEPVTGRFTVLDVSGDGMMLQADPLDLPIAVPFSSVTQLHVNRGPRTGGAGAVRGAVFGFLIGGAIGVVGGFADGDDPDGLVSFSAEQKAMGAGMVLGGAGAVVGGIVGLASPGHQWERVANTVTLRPTPRSDGVVVALSLRL